MVQYYFQKTSELILVHVLIIAKSLLLKSMAVSLIQAYLFSVVQTILYAASAKYDCFLKKFKLIII